MALSALLSVIYFLYFILTIIICYFSSTFKCSRPITLIPLKFKSLSISLLSFWLSVTNSISLSWSRSRSLCSPLVYSFFLSPSFILLLLNLSPFSNFIYYFFFSSGNKVFRYQSWEAQQLYAQLQSSQLSDTVPVAGLYSYGAFTRLQDSAMMKSGSLCALM